MVRTKNDAFTKAGGKAPRKSSAGNAQLKSIKKKSTGRKCLNPAVRRPIPKWQRPITEYLNDSNGLVTPGLDKPCTATSSSEMVAEISEEPSCSYLPMPKTISDEDCGAPKIATKGDVIESSESSFEISEKKDCLDNDIDNDLPETAFKHEKKMKSNDNSNFEVCTDEDFKDNEEENEDDFEDEFCEGEEEELSDEEFEENICQQSEGKDKEKMET